MIDALVNSMASDSGLSADQIDRVQSVVGQLAARMGPMDMLGALGTLMAAKGHMDAGNHQLAYDTVRQLAERYGLAVELAVIADELASDGD